MKKLVFIAKIMLLLCSFTAFTKKMDDDNAWLNKAYELYLQGRYEEALKAYEKAIEIKPDLAGAWNNKGNVFAKLGKYNEALKAYDKAIKIKPDLLEDIRNYSKLTIRQ